MRSTNFNSLSQWRFYGGGGANRALAPPKLVLAPQKVCGLIGLKTCILVTALQLMRLFRNAMTVSKIFSSIEAKMVHIWPNLRYSLYTDSSLAYSFRSFNISARDDDLFAASTINLQLSSLELNVCSCMVLMLYCYINYKKQAVHHKFA